MTRARLFSCVFGLAVLLAANASASSLEEALATDWGKLSYVVESAMAEDEKGGTLVVFLHGYGGDARGSRGLGRALLAEGVRVVIPEAVPRHPSGRGAMWWAFLPDDWPRPYPLDPSVETRPAESKQLPLARNAVIDLVGRMRTKYEPERTMLVGFSQGAMLSIDVATRIEPPLDRVAAISGYVLLDSVAQIESKRAKQPEFLLVHGRKDSVVSFDSMAAAGALLGGHGALITLVPHDGGHVIDAKVVDELRGFLVD